MPLSKKRMRERKQSERGTVKPEVETLLESPLILTKRQRLELLSDYARKGNPKFVNPVLALAEISKLLGDYPATKHDFNIVEFNITYTPPPPVATSGTGGVLELGGSVVSDAP